MGKLVQGIFHIISAKEYHRAENYEDDYFTRGISKAKDLLSGFDGKVDITQKAVIDVGCGYGDSCIYMALNGAARVLGIDINEDRVSFAKSKLARNYPELSDIVEFRLADSAVSEKFDIVFSKDCFQCYSDPENFIFTMKQFMKPDGIIAIRFGPLWKAPYGGGGTYVTKVPWVHLLFPESVIKRERRRLRSDEDATSFEFRENRDSQNKMTLKRYINIIKNSGLKTIYFKTNVMNTKWKVLFNILKEIPFCREYFTQNIYSIMRL